MPAALAAYLNHPRERTGYSVGFFAIRLSLPCRPPLTGGVIIREVLSNTCKGSMRKADMANQPEIIVVGAGVMGCGTAYWLSKAGYKVLVLEQEAIACGASGVAAAMLEAVGHGAHLAVNDPLTAFARAGFELHQEL